MGHGVAITVALAVAVPLGVVSVTTTVYVEPGEIPLAIV
jgi:hypothetical protein